MDLLVCCYSFVLKAYCSMIVLRNGKGKFILAPTVLFILNLTVKQSVNGHLLENFMLHFKTQTLWSLCSSSICCINIHSC